MLGPHSRDIFHVLAGTSDLSLQVFSFYLQGHFLFKVDTTRGFGDREEHVWAGWSE